MSKVLFIVKCRGMSYEKQDDTVPIPGDPYSFCLSSGLFNSANFVNHMLNREGIESKIVQVIDNNCIDREVHRFKPTHVIIEALWVVPEKFEVLRKLHPNVTWVVRLHSDMPFIANEGNAMKWVLEYLKQPNILIAPNTKEMLNDVRTAVEAAHGYEIARKRVVFLPNYYEFGPVRREPKNPNELHIGCFGAIRPLKNQLQQVIAAIEYAGGINKKLVFHINAGRVEHGNNVLKNIQDLFAELDKTKYELVQHAWMRHQHFINLVRRMDLGLQVSFTETFNIVAADFVSQGVPVVVSSEIEWVNCLFKASPTSSDSIRHKISWALALGKIGTFFNLLGLHQYNKKSVRLWTRFFRHFHRNHYF